MDKILGNKKNIALFVLPGFKNYINLFNDVTFRQALGNNILMVIGSLIAHVPLALFFANIIFNKIKGSHFFQTVFFLPSVICGVAVGLMWTFIYNPEFGLVNKILEMLGLGGLKQQWLSNPKTTLICIIVVVMWQFVGYHMITGSLKYYDLIAVMTGGGPDHASELLSTYMYYQGFRNLKYGYSASIGTILLILCVLAVVLSNTVFKSEKIEY